MGLILGIHDGTHDAAAALVQDGQIIVACDEERFVRKKGAGGWPTHSIQACLNIADVQIQDIDNIAFAGFVNPNPMLRVFRSRQKQWRLDDGRFYQSQPSLRRQVADWLQFRSPFPRLTSNDVPYSSLLHAVLRRQTQQHLGWDKSVGIFDHHRCHAASCYFQSGFEESLVVILDGVGDGLSATIWTGQGHSLTRIGTMPYPNSYGLLYSSITGFLGFRPFRHEGKLTGLSAHGNPENIPIPFPFTGTHPNRTFTERYPLHSWLRQLSPYDPKDISAWLQQGLETEAIALIQYYMKTTGLQNISLAGGVFANVRLNQKIAEQCPIKNMFVFPNMGDGGLAVGAALCVSEKQEGWTPQRLESAFLGVDLPEAEVQAAIQKYNLKTKPYTPQDVAKLLEQGKLVGICHGRMEYGPRALGHRSILANPSDLSIVQRLNTALKRSDFMPFAPIILASSIEECVHWKPIFEHNTQFMTTTMQATPTMQEKCPAVVHIDGSLRPQLVQESQHPRLWNILLQFQKMTHIPALINTSLNIHEEPIVATAEEAVRAYLQASLDALILGDYIVTPSK